MSLIVATMISKIKSPIMQLLKRLKGYGASFVILIT